MCAESERRLVFVHCEQEILLMLAGDMEVEGVLTRSSAKKGVTYTI